MPYNLKIPESIKKRCNAILKNHDVAFEKNFNASFSNLKLLPLHGAQRVQDCDELFMVFDFNNGANKYRHILRYTVDGNDINITKMLFYELPLLQ